MKIVHFLPTCGGLLFAIAALGTTDTPENALSEADFEEFARAGVFDPMVSNRRANELIVAAITHGNPKIAELAIRAMSAHAQLMVDGLSADLMELLEVPSTTVNRNFAQVPGLKRFLIKSWRESVKRDKPNPMRLPPAGFRKTVLENADYPSVAGAGDFADWTIIPVILAAYFPGDDDVHQLIWKLSSEAIEDGGTFHVLLLLNLGRFNTPEANDLRFKTLRSENWLDVLYAAQGLAILRPAGGLETLVAVLNEKETGGVASIVNAIVAYGSDAIPYLEKLRAWRDAEGVLEHDRRALKSGVAQLEAIAAVRDKGQIQ